MTRRHAARWLRLAAALAAPLPLAASTYFPISDDALRAESNVVAVVHTVSSRVVRTDERFTETRTRCTVEAVARGSAAPEIEVAIPGGRLPDGRGSYFWMPELAIDREYVLFLRCRSDNRFSLTEGALGLFEIDATGTAARRPGFGTGPLSHVVALDALLEGGLPTTLNAEAAAAVPAPEPQWVSFNPNPPAVVFARWTGGARVNVGFVDDDLADAPHGAKGVPGGGVPQILAAVDSFTNDPESNINYNFIGEGSATITIHLDNVSQFNGEGFPCATGIQGELGIAEIEFLGDHDFKGSTYDTITNAIVWLRRWDCTQSEFLTSAFENQMLHELGHTLGLGHPDTGTSPHDFTPNDFEPTATDPGAVMLSLLLFERPVGLGTDDLEGLCYLYGACDPTGPPPPPPPPRVAAGIVTGALRSIRGRK